MIKLHEAYINALLTDATYVNLNIDQPLNSYGNSRVLGERMTLPQAQFIANHFEIISAIDTPDDFGAGSGFDAIVWRGRVGTEFEGQVFVSMRGTELTAQDYLADADLALVDAARAQIVDMVNWWLRETTPAGEQARQIRNDTTFTVDPTLPAPIVEHRIELADTVLATGNLVGVSQVRVNGHSLGGHLATSFARIFGGDIMGKPGSVRVESVQTFNSAGFLGNRAEPLFQGIQNLLGTGFSSFAPVSARQANFFARNGIELTTNTWWFDQMGRRLGLNQEEGTGLPNHFMYKITDVLALGYAMGRLDPSFILDDFNRLLGSGSNQTEASIEGVFDSLRRMLEGMNITPSSIGDVAESAPSREEYHAALGRFNRDHKHLAGKLRFTVTADILDLSTRAQQEFGLFLALQALSPVAIETTDAGALAALAGAHSDLHEAWQADRARAAAGEPALHYSPQWYEDRVVMLTQLIERNNVDHVIVPDNRNLQYVDRASGTQILVGRRSTHRARYIFGREETDTDLEGAGHADRIYGGGGNDHLYGRGGNDYLEGGTGEDRLEGGAGSDMLIGGAGQDTYVLSTLDSGVDTIYDSDGQGHIELDGSVINARFGQLAGGHAGFDYYSNDADRRYKLSRNAQGVWQLFAKVGHSYVLVANLQGWQDGQLGLRLDAGLIGDPLPTQGLSFPDISVHFNFDASHSPYGVYLVGGDRSDSFSGSAYADVITTGDGQGHYVLAHGGNDLIQGGSGREYIRTGANAHRSVEDNDTVLAGEGTDMVYGGAGDDIIWGNIANNEFEITAADSDQRGDWLSGELGNDFIAGSRSQDMIFGGAGADTLLGGAGNDLLLGDARYSVGSRATGLGYSAANTYSYVWQADGSLRGPLNQSDYGFHAVQIPSATIHNWSWSGTEDDFSIQLAAGVIFLNQIRIDDHGGNDRIDGGDGDDWIAGQTGDDILMGGAGDDIIYGDDIVPLPNGAPDGDDQLFAGAGRDVLYGGGGDDALYAHDDDGQQDRLYGGAGDDTLYGGTGGDILHGGDGDDTLYAGSDGSTLYGGAGFDRLFGGEGNDRLEGGADDDFYTTSGGYDNIVDEQGDDTYAITLQSLADGTRTNIQDADGIGQLRFDGWPLNENTVVATADNQWSIQGNSGLGLLSRQGNALLIRAEGMSGEVVIENFFNRDTFLGLKLPPYEAPTQPTQPTQPNRPPVAGSALIAQSVDEDSAFSYSLPADAFSDPDGDTLSYGASLSDGSALPAWLSFDAASGTLSGTPDNDDVGSLDVRITATDPQGARVSQTLSITVNNVNDAPQPVQALEDQSGTEGQLLQFGLVNSAFVDPDLGDTLSYSASLLGGGALPDWLEFNANSGTFRGTPPAGSAQDWVIVVTATDSEGLSASQSFVLSVAVPGPDTPAAIVGTEGDDQLTGQDADEHIFGMQGNDILHGMGGDDHLYGGEGQDQLWGGDGNDLLDGEAGDDYLYGGDGDDQLFGFTGDDYLDGGAGDDRLYGWEGDDVLHGGLGNDLLNGEAGNDQLWGGAGDDQLFGFTGDDRLDGGQGDDRLYGEQGNDQLFGGSGDDLLDGGQGDDLLNGGTGNDQLFGGAGSDRYEWGLGQGSDLIVEVDAQPGDEDVVHLLDIASTDAWSLMRVGDDLHLIINGDALMIQGQLSDGGAIERFEFSDGVSLSAADMADRLAASTKQAPASVAPTAAVTPQLNVDALISAMASFAPEAAASSWMHTQDMHERNTAMLAVSV